MTTLLKTPAAWPKVLLERAAAPDPTDLDAATRAGAFDGLRRVIRNFGATATTAMISGSGLRGAAAPATRPREVADRRRRPMPPAATS